MPQRITAKNILVMGNEKSISLCQAFAEENCHSVLVQCHSDIKIKSDVAKMVYIKSFSWQAVEKIIAEERPDAIVSTMGDSLILDCGLDLVREGILEKYQVKWLGTSAKTIEKMKDREVFQALVAQLKLQQPGCGWMKTLEEGFRLAKILAYPLSAQVSKEKKVVFNESDFIHYIQNEMMISSEQPLYLEHFLDNATIIQLSAICDGENIFIPDENQRFLRYQVSKISNALEAVGCIGIRFAVQDNRIYVLNINLGERPEKNVTRQAARCLLGIPLLETYLSESAYLL